MMDCTAFKEMEIDALYGELDAAASAAMAEHAATCHDCSARFERLKGTRGLVLSHAVEAVPTDFESRIMAAVNRGLAQRAAPMHAGAAGAAPLLHLASAPPPPAGAPFATPKKPEESGAKIFKFMSRPAFAVAATFVLVIGAAAILMTQSSRMAPMAASDRAAGAPAASAMTPVPMENPGAVAAATATAPPAMVPGAADMPAASGAIALGESDQGGLAKARSAGGAPVMAPAVVAAAEPPPPPAAAPAFASKPSKSAPAKTGGGPSGDDRAFAAAKALYSAGRYADALPKFEALKASNPEAELYAARCIQHTRGCAAAAPRYDSAAQANAGTETGNRATLEGAKCYQASGQVAEARKRYAVAKDEDGVADEAAKALESLDARPAGAGSPATHAAPKAPAPNTNTTK